MSHSKMQNKIATKKYHKKYIPTSAETSKAVKSETINSSLEKKPG